MAWDFPASPTEGATYTPAGGPTYTFTSGVWRILPPASSALSTANVSDTPPANPVQGQIWWKSDTGETFIWYDDASADTGQWVQQSDASLPDAPSDGNQYARLNGAWASLGLPGWKPIAYLDCAIVGTKTFWDFAWPASMRMLRITGQAFIATGSNYIVAQVSTDGGATFKSTGYAVAVMSQDNNAVSAAPFDLSYPGLPVAAAANDAMHLNYPLNTTMFQGTATTTVRAEMINAGFQATVGFNQRMRVGSWNTVGMVNAIRIIPTSGDAMSAPTRILVEGF